MPLCPKTRNVAYLNGNHPGSVSAATGATGAVLSRQAFSPWGERRAEGGEVTGQLWDTTGLLFYNARYCVRPSGGSTTSISHRSLSQSPTISAPSDQDRSSCTPWRICRWCSSTVAGLPAQS